jgi:hypothetical protein
MSGAFEGHPLLVLALGLLAAPLLDGELRFMRLRREAWQLPLAGALVAVMALLLRLSPALAAPRPSGLAAWPWLAAWLIGLLLPLALLQRLWTGGGGLADWLAVAPLPVFWAFLDPFAGRLPADWIPPATGLAGALLLALLTGAQEKFRRNSAPDGLDGLPFRLLSLALILLLVLGLEALLAGRLP